MVRKYSKNSTNPNRAHQIWVILVGAAWNRQVLTYKLLSQWIGYKGPGVLDKTLGHIMHYCHQNKLPPLTTLVVNEKNGKPGGGLSKSKNTVADRERVYRYGWYAIFPPTPEQLKEAWDNAS